MSMNRRQLCQHIIYVGFGSYLAVAAGACRRTDRDADRDTDSSRGGSGLLTPAEYATLAAACERLFPGDDDPGAIALGAPGYVERQLGSTAFSAWEPWFRSQLGALDADARGRYKRSFAELQPGEQDALIDAWIHGPRPRATFVSRLMHLTLEGVFGDPSHGGNKGGAAWALVGFAPSSPRPSDHHRM
jgi:gluconate 2-dehydrogenase gamma chain